MIAKIQSTIGWIFFYFDIFLSASKLLKLRKIMEEKSKVIKKDLIDSIHEKCSYEKEDILKIVDLFMDELKSEFVKKNSVELRGFGTFEARLRKGRKSARNPKTGENISFEDRYTIVFRPGTEIKKSLREEK